MGATFDVLTDSAWFFSAPPESTQFVEALWRRLEPVPDAHGRQATPSHGQPSGSLPFVHVSVLQRERVNSDDAGAIMIALATELDALGQYDLTSLAHIAYGGAPMAPHWVAA